MNINSALVYGIIFILLLLFVCIRKLQNIQKEKDSLFRENRKLDAYFNDSSDGIIILKDGKYVDVNWALIKLFKFKTKEEFLKMQPGSMAPLYQEDGEKSVHKIQRLVKECENKKLIRFDWQCLDSLENLFLIEIIMTKITYENEIAFHFLFRDMSTSKKNEKDLKLQKNFFESLFKRTSDALLIVENKTYVDCNQSALNLLKIQDKKILRNIKVGSLAPIYQSNGDLSVEIFAKAYEECMKNSYARYDRELATTNGEVFWAHVILIKIEVNKRVIVYAIIRDISKYKALEKEVIQRASDFQRANEELEDSNEELQMTIENLKLTQNKLIESEKMASLGGLVAGIAHEINTPVGIGLTGISHLEEMSKLISSKYDKDEMQQEEFEEYLQTSKELSLLIHKNLNKAASLVRSFKLVAVDQSSEEKRVFNVKEYVSEVLASLHSVTKKKDIVIEVFCLDDININSYPGAFSQVLSNLILNSMIHGFKNKEKGLISLHIKKKKKELHLVYEDDGCGIKKNDLPKIFDPFFTTNRKNGGSGLGLNIIYNIIISGLNGSIKCKSKFNEGVEFTILIKL